MTYLAETEAQRLTLHHLSSLFFHGEPADAVISYRQIGQDACITVTARGKTVTETVTADPVRHAGAARGEKVAMGLAFARAAQHFSPHRPPYGTLSGVRPVKVPLFYLDQGRSREEILSLLEEDYWVSPEKAQLLWELAKTEYAFRETVRPHHGMLYLSIPFCPSRCSYCSFVSSAAPRHLSLIPAYLEQLKEEISLTAALMQECGKTLTSIYVGGGTPGILSAREMEELLAHLERLFPTDTLLEYCVEMGRPDTVSPEKLKVLRNHGVNRISINPQTTQNKTLARIGRKHSAEDYFRAMEWAKAENFPVINCDLIAALPGETPEEFLTSVRDVLACEPENLTVHALCKKKSAREEDPGMLPEFALAMAQVPSLCMKSQLLPYYCYRQKMAAADLENLGFAKEGALGIYNLAMMEDLVDIFACGAGAIGKLLPKTPGEKILRFAQFKYPHEYLSQPQRIPERIAAMKEALCRKE